MTDREMSVMERDIRFMLFGDEVEMLDSYLDALGRQNVDGSIAQLVSEALWHRQADAMQAQNDTETD